MLKLSAGLLMYRFKDGANHVLLAHLGGPYFVNRDQFPEIDRAEMFDMETARSKVKAEQVGLIDELEMILNKNDLDGNFFRV